jgi:hypothetical protein
MIDFLIRFVAVSTVVFGACALWMIYRDWKNRP